MRKIGKLRIKLKLYRDLKINLLSRSRYLPIGFARSKKNINSEKVLLNILLPETTEEIADFSEFSSKQIWLLDISNFASNGVVFEVLKKANLKLDQELYCYRKNGSNSKIDIWEIYGISELFLIKTSYFGNWSRENGLKINNLPKWLRRSNLEVFFFKNYIPKSDTCSEFIFSLF